MLSGNFLLAAATSAPRTRPESVFVLTEILRLGRLLIIRRRRCSNNNVVSFVKLAYAHGGEKGSSGRYRLKTEILRLARGTERA